MLPKISRAKLACEGRQGTGKADTASRSRFVEDCHDSPESAIITPALTHLRDSNPRFQNLVVECPAPKATFITRCPPHSKLYTDLRHFQPWQEHVARHGWNSAFSNRNNSVKAYWEHNIRLGNLEDDCRLSLVTRLKCKTGFDNFFRNVRPLCMTYLMFPYDSLALFELEYLTYLMIAVILRSVLFFQYLLYP